MRKIARVFVPVFVFAVICAWSGRSSVLKPFNFLTTANAGTNTWTALGPDGGRISALAVDPTQSGVLYAGTEDGVELFKSSDGGATWGTVDTGLSIGPITALACDSQGTVYLGTSSGIMKGSNKGISWSAESSPLTQISSFAFASKTLIFASTRGNGVLKSTDGGATFQAANNGLTAMDLLTVTLDASGNVYAGANSGGGVFKADPNATNWASADGNLGQGAIVTQLLGDKRGAVYLGGTGVYKTTDGGATWNPADSGLGGPPEAMAIDSNGVVYAEAELSGLYKTTDGGSSWHKIASWPSTRFNVLAVDPLGSAVYGGAEGGLFREMGGNPWAAASNGLAATEVEDLAFDPTASGAIYAACFGAGIYKSTDDGSSWSLLGGPLVDVEAVAVDSTGVVIAGGQGGIETSTDHGATWTRPPTASTSTVSALDVSTSTYYAAGQAGIERSTDGGATWTSTTTGLSGAALYSIVLDPTSPDTIYAGAGFNGSGAYKSVDGGATWTPANSGFTSPFVALAIDPSGTLYATSFTSNMYKSTDHAATWTRLQNAPTGAFTVAFDSSGSGAVYAGNDSGVFKSTDGGASWTEALDSADFPSGLQPNAIVRDPGNPGSILVGLLGGGALQGQFTAQSSGGPSITSATFTPPKTLVITGSGFGTSPAVKINGTDVSNFIRSASDTRIQMKGKAKRMGLKSGANSIQVFNNGVGSGAFTLNL